MIHIRRSHHRLIFIMRNPHICKDGRYIEILLDKLQMNWLEFNWGFNFKLQHRSTDCKTHRPPLVRHWTGSALVQVMACRLFGAKPSPEPMLVYCQLDSWQQISVKLESEFYHFHWRNLKLSSANTAPILSRGRWVNNTTLYGTL